MKILTKRDFDSLYQGMRDYPLDTIYQMYVKMMVDIKTEIVELKQEVETLKSK